MKMRILLLMFVGIWSVVEVLAQESFDTLRTNDNSTHMYLNIAVPKGKIHIQSSNVCGASIARTVSTRPAARPQVKQDLHGNMTVTVGTAQETPDELIPKSVPAASNMQKFKQEITSFSSLARVGYSNNESEVTTEFRPDPTLSTELNVNVGSGGSKLDLSGLNLYKASINSAFSDVWVYYNKPNQCVMKKMDIHAVRAKVTVENIEYARAELISVQNDMGDTEVRLNNHEQPGSTIYLSSGAGNCKLLIHRDHPAKIVIRKGFFSTVEVQGDFEILDKSAFVNSNYQPESKYTTIICNTDFGKIFIQETDN